MSSAQKVTFTFDNAKYELVAPASDNGKYTMTLQPGQVVTNVAKYRTKGARFSWSVYKFSKTNA